VLGVHVDRRLGVQPRVAQPHEVPREDGELDVEAFEHACDVVFLAQEILVGYSSYPTPRSAEREALPAARLGYANLGALLMARGLPYDSDEGRAYAAAITG
jgi:ribonucleoside-diphosphate reductase alpha chain